MDFVPKIHLKVLELCKVIQLHFNFYIYLAYKSLKCVIKFAWINKKEKIRD